jgi:hypothetical protein
MRDRGGARDAALGIAPVAIAWLRGASGACGPHAVVRPRAKKVALTKMKTLKRDLLKTFAKIRLAQLRQFARSAFATGLLSKCLELVFRFGRQQFLRVIVSRGNNVFEALPFQQSDTFDARLKQQVGKFAHRLLLR